MNRQTDNLSCTGFADGQQFLSEIGLRVRSARESLGLTRKELSQTSGVSERHLAQLETGKGNISVRLLQQISHAIDTPIDQLVSVQPSDPITSKILGKISKLDFESRTEVLKQIDLWISQHHGQGKNGRIALIGLRGAGKSTIGKRAAEQLDLPFVELDEEITSSSGISVADIFTQHGEPRYRELEKSCLEKVITEHSDFVLAVAGGIVSNSETYSLLLRSFHTIWLTAEPEEHMGRVMAQGDRRPVEGNPDAMNNLRTLLTSRQPQYELAPFRLDTSGKTVVECSEQLAALIASLKQESN